VREFYPNARIVDSEVPTNLPLDQWLAILDEWLKEYKAAVGAPLDALSMDLNFRRPWLDATQATINVLHRNGTRAGIYLNAPGGRAMTDAVWVAEAKANITAVQSAHLPLDYVIIASWVPYPSQILPESDPFSLTSVAYWYLHKREETGGR
jgi:hypothetical protein